ncbi:MAG: hypothetical protein ACYSU5_20710 [Planctomycetota bacterium]|jgi:Mn-dependent DtxR family transcriptional regulator
MNRKREKDEHIEQLYYMKEEGKVSINDLKSALDTGYDEDITNELLSEDLLELDKDNNTIALTKNGEDYARYSWRRL